MNWYRHSSRKLYWKNHLAEHFLNGKAPIKNNGVGKGGHVFSTIQNIISRCGREKYWVCPVMLADNEVKDCGGGMFEALVARLSKRDFAPIEFLEKHSP